MKDTILIGRGKLILELPTDMWRKHLASSQLHTAAMLSFMTGDHHLVRNFVVRELPRNHGKPLSPEDISQGVNLPLSKVTTILADLHKSLFFLVRNNAGEVSWAFPVTSERTPHRLTFSSGEQTFAAGAEDAFATPFVQGRLRGERLSVEIETACAHCGHPLHLTLDSELNWSIKESDALPLLFVPEIDWEHFEGSDIIHDYGQSSLFFWSEEHAREYRFSQQQIDGKYLTLAQSSYFVRIAQSALFGFEVPLTSSQATGYDFAWISTNPLALFLFNLFVY